MRQGDGWVFPLAYLLAGAGVLLVAVDTTGFLTVGVACGSAAWSWLGAAHMITGAPAAIAFHGPAGCMVPAAAVWAGFGAAVLLLGGLVLAGWVAWRVFTQSATFYLWDVLSRDGIARRREVEARFGPKQLVKRAAFLRPAIPANQARPEDVGFMAGVARAVQVFIDAESSIAVDGPPRMRKSTLLVIPAILAWRGPVVTTSTRSDVINRTIAARSAMGEVTVFDPEGLTGQRTTVKISPIPGCENVTTARQRAAMLVAGSGLGQSESNQEFAGFAIDYITCLLHAAALGGKSLRDVAVWGVDAVASKPAVAILRQHGVNLLAEMLDSVIGADNRERGARWFGVASALAPLMDPAILAAMSPDDGETLFDIEKFLSGNNTLYLVGSGATAASLGGFLGQLLNSIYLAADKKAVASVNSRIDPPLGLILDEIFNIFAWPELPGYMSRAGGAGIWMMVILQSKSQMAGVWNDAKADALWSSANIQLLLGGQGDASHMDDMVKIIGDRKVRTSSRTVSESGGSSTNHSKQLVPVITVSEINRLPDGWALMKSKNVRVALLQLLPANDPRRRGTKRQAMG